MIDTLPPSVRSTLLRAARGALRAHATGAASPTAPAGGVLDHPSAVFVTLRVGEELRGCIGHVAFELPLGRAVCDMTRAAAGNDPRFSPIGSDEVDRTVVEISRLSTFARVTPDRVEVGRHGIVISHAGRSGLLLPQVATEFDCDRAGFLALGCRKAGLAPDAWQAEDVSVEVFEAEVFGE